MAVGNANSPKAGRRAECGTAHHLYSILAVGRGILHRWLSMSFRREKMMRSPKRRKREIHSVYDAPGSNHRSSHDSVEKLKARRRLHDLLQLPNVPFEQVKHVVDTFDETDWVWQDSDGNTPLHLALSCPNRDLNVVRLLSKNFRVMKVLNYKGLYPVDVCLKKRCLETLKLLLTIYPHNANLALRTGTRLSWYYQSSDHSNHLWKWEGFRLIVRCAHYGSVNLRSLHNLPVLHATIALNLKAETLDAVVKDLARSQAGVRDVHGLYPLHYAVKSSKIKEHHLRRLARYFPPAVKAKLPCGNFPMTVGLKNELDCAMVLLERFGRVATVPEASTGLLPVFIAAERCTVGTIFCLLRANPSAIAQLRTMSTDTSE